MSEYGRHSRCIEATSGSVEYVSLLCEEDPTAVICGKDMKDAEYRFTWMFAKTRDTRTFKIEYKINKHLEFDKRSREDTLRMNIMYGQIKPHIGRFGVQIMLPVQVELIQAVLALGPDNVKTLRRSPTRNSLYQEMTNILPKSLMQVKAVWIDPGTLIDVPKESIPVYKTVRAKNEPIQFLAHEDPWNRRYPFDADSHLMTQRTLDIWRPVAIDEKKKPRSNTHSSKELMDSRNSQGLQSLKALNRQKPLENPLDSLASALSDEADAQRKAELERSRAAVREEIVYLQGTSRELDNPSLHPSVGNTIDIPSYQTQDNQSQAALSQISDRKALSSSSNPSRNDLRLSPSDGSEENALAYRHSTESHNTEEAGHSTIHQDGQQIGSAGDRLHGNQRFEKLVDENGHTDGGVIETQTDTDAVGSNTIDHVMINDAQHDVQISEPKGGSKSNGGNEANAPTKSTEETQRAEESKQKSATLGTVKQSLTIKSKYNTQKGGASLRPSSKEKDIRFGSSESDSDVGNKLLEKHSDESSPSEVSEGSIYESAHSTKESKSPSDLSSEEVASSKSSKHSTQSDSYSSSDSHSETDSDSDTDSKPNRSENTTNDSPGSGFESESPSEAEDLTPSIQPADLPSHPPQEPFQPQQPEDGKNEVAKLGNQALGEGSVPPPTKDQDTQPMEQNDELEGF